MRVSKMGSAARMIIDSVEDFACRVSDVSPSSSPPKYHDIYAGYARLALEPGSAVLIFAPNGTEFLFHWIAVLANGCVPCAVATSTKSPLISALLNTLHIAAIVGPRLDPARHQGRRFMRIGEFIAVVRNGIPPAYEPFEVLILTTGTSGSQSACVHSLESLAWNAGRTVQTLNITSADRQLIILPMYHTYGLVTQALGAFLSGCKLKIDGPPFNAGRFAELISKERITICGITPAIAHDLLRRQTELPPLRSLSIGGDRLGGDNVSNLLAKPFINELYITYGLTEAGPRVSVLPAHDAPKEALDSVGRAFDGISTKIEDPDADGVGQLLVKTPSACRRKVGSATERQLFTSDGYLKTGDLFTKNAAGYLRYIGRRADVLVIKGEKLNTQDVDRVAASHPDVEYARTMEGEGNSLVTRLWAKDDRTLDLEEVRSFMRPFLRLHEIPDRLIQQGKEIFHK
jgi:long-chain acyl-CoA synthetase